MKLNTIYNEDCLKGMKKIPDNSVDMVLCDLPYGTTKEKWDIKLPLDELWREYKRILRPMGAIVLTASNPFTAELIMSNKKSFSHQWIWEKESGVNPLAVKKIPFKNFEDVIVFYNKGKEKNDYNKASPLRDYAKKLKQYIDKTPKQLREDFIKLYPETKGHQVAHFMSPNSVQFCLCTKQTYKDLQKLYSIENMNGFIPYDKLKVIETKYKRETKQKRIYNPQMTTGTPYIGKGTKQKETSLSHLSKLRNKPTKKNTGTRYPKSIIKFNRATNTIHATQKPIPLFEYLIKTYTNEGDLVLDNCMGSGTTAVACINTNRNYIGFEKDPTFYKKSLERINDVNKAKHKKIK